MINLKSLVILGIVGIGTYQLIDLKDNLTQSYTTSIEKQNKKLNTQNPTQPCETNNFKYNPQFKTNTAQTTHNKDTYYLTNKNKFHAYYKDMNVTIGLETSNIPEKVKLKLEQIIQTCENK